MSFNSKYKGQEVEQLLDKISSGNIDGGGQNIYISDGIVPDNENILLWVDESISTDQLDYLTESAANELYVKKDELPEQVTQDTVSGWGFTKNQGTITEVKMNGTSKGTSGVVDLGNVITEHQDISGKQDNISDLEAIRNGAALGTTALQEEQYKGTIAAVDTNEEVEEPDIPNNGGGSSITEIKLNGNSLGTSGVIELNDIATYTYVANAIEQAITTTLNTEV